MADGYLAVSDGTYTFSETDVKNQFYFFRNDDGVLENITREPMELYQAYIMNKMSNGEITDVIMSNIHYEQSVDGRCIRMTVSDIGETKANVSKNSDAVKKSSFFNRLKKKIFG